jgi:excinuclease ABC subunit C
VFSITSDVNHGYVNFMKVNNGAIIQSHTIELKKKLDETDDQLLELAIPELREQFNSLSREIFVSEPLELEIPNVTLHNPQRGDKKKLIELSKKNAHYYMRERHQMLEKTDPERHVNRLMLQMKEDLRLTEEPRHIECFDNSNFQGAYPVAACVVFKNGKPAKKEYRHFNIKTVEGPNDFASMEEVVYRRYRRLLHEGKDLPQLIIIDGGKGQLSSAVEALDRLGIRQQVAIIGIAKKLEELFYPGDSIPLYLDKRSETLKVIQNLRNEAHRFGITFHRDKRSKGTITTELENINGIGSKTAEALLQQFKSVKRIRDASLEELQAAIGLQKAQLVRQYFDAEV